MLIYLIENLIDHKIYIGQTVRTLKKRMYDHKSSAKKKILTNLYLYRATNKYGWDNFKVMVLDGFIKTQEELDKLECWWIKIFQSINPDIGYNLSNGGNGPGKCTNETKKKISNATKGAKNPFFGKKHTKESLIKIKEASTGENHPNFGKHLSEETRNKIGIANSNFNFEKEKELEIFQEYLAGNTSQRKLAKKYMCEKTTIRNIINKYKDTNLSFKKPAWNKNTKGLTGGWNKGILLSAETKEKLSKTMKGRKHSAETRSKISKANIGKKHSLEFCEKMSNLKKGIKCSEEQNKRNSESHKGQIPWNKKITEAQEKEMFDKYNIGNTTYIKLGEEYNSYASSVQRAIKRYSLRLQNMGEI